MKKKIKKVIIALLSLVIAIIPIQVSAYKLGVGKIDLGAKFIPSAYFGETTYSHMNEALWQWNKEAGKTIFTISNERHYNDNDSRMGYNKALSLGDYTHMIYREKRSDLTGVGETAKKATVYSNIFGSWTVIENADILINIRYSFANSAKVGCFDTWSVFLHEAGHALGIAEASDKTYSTAVMYPFGEMNSTKRYLLQDDKNALNAKGY